MIKSNQKKMCVREFYRALNFCTGIRIRNVKEVRQGKTGIGGNPIPESILKQSKILNLGGGFGLVFNSIKLCKLECKCECQSLVTRKKEKK